MGALGIPGGVLRRTAAVADALGADAGELLTGRAALLGLTPRGRVSAGAPRTDADRRRLVRVDAVAR